MATTAANPPAAPAAAGDELDDLFDYNVNLDDVFRDVDTNMQAPTASKPTAIPSRTKTSSSKVDSLGIDEEVKVQRKRAPVAKLDEDRLLSKAGIPKLRRITKERLRFKGKGHEYSDVARLLQHYQLWLDELYPRAKFADGLVMIEKLGHKKRLQTMRREWIDEGKPRRTTIEEDAIPDDEPRKDMQDHELPNDKSSGSVHGARPRTPPPARDADDDLYGATPQAVQEQRRREREAEAGKSLFLSDDEGDDGPEGDELDALLAEDDFQQDGGMSNSTVLRAPSHAHAGPEEDFNDEMEAMAGMDDMW